jgi:rhodanese-related sulfurtransferase
VPRALSPAWLTLAVLAAAAGGGDAQDAPVPSLEAIRQATAPYRDLGAALRAGYIHDPSLMCVDAAMVGQPDSLGAMGLHLFSPGLAGIRLPQPTGQRLTGDDAALDWLHPEVLVYEPQRDASLQLVAVEYLVFEAAWRKAGHEGPPKFGGETFELMKDDPATQKDESHMLDPHYELHVWLHRENPLGMFKEFNPRVTCANYAARGLSQPDVQAATWPEAAHGAQQVSTEELRTFQRRGDALVLDVRKPREYHLGHIPGAFGLESGEGPQAVVATARRLVRMDRTRAVVLYGDGVNSEEARRGADALLADGFVNLRRYQLGLAVWQALGGVTEVDREGLPLAWRDPSAVFVDGRETAEARGDRLTGMVQLEVPQVARGAGEGKLPADPATRMIAVGRETAQARALAEQLVRKGYRRVAFFGGTWAEFRRITGPGGREPSS